MENSHLPNIFRDSQVLAIWEGTTNVLCLDFYRALVGTPSALNSYIQFIQAILLNSVTNENGLFKETVFKNVYSELVAEFNSNLTLINDVVLSAKFKTHSHHLRDIVMNFVRIFISALLLEHSLASGREKDVDIFIRWCSIAPKYTVDLTYDVNKVRRIGIDPDALGVQREKGDIDARGVVRPRF